MSEARRFSFEYVRPPDRRDHYASTLLYADSRCIALTHELHPSKPLHLFGEEVLAGGYRAVFFLFKGEPYDVGRVYRPDGTWTGFYVDVLEPVQWEGDDPSTLKPLVDLFLDIWIAPDGTFLVLDEDELTEALSSGAITEAQAGHARHVVDSLLQSIRAGTYPPPIVRDTKWD